MEIGAKIRLLRKRCGLTQEELGARCELTKGYISQLENDLASPSISTLEDLLNVLGVSLGDFFKTAEKEKVVYTKDDFFFNETEKSTVTWLVTDSQKREMEPIILELPPESETEAEMPFVGEMFGYVLSGSPEVRLGTDTYALKKGEVFYFRADKEYSIINGKKTPAKVLWVSTPPNF